MPKTSFIGVGDIHLVGKVGNIEGGLPALKLQKNNTKSLWANLVVILDRPWEDITFDELFRQVEEKKYKMLENGINCLNEHKFLIAYMSIILYYLNNGHKLLNLEKNKLLHIKIHLHQDKRFNKILQLIELYLIQLHDHIKNPFRVTYASDNWTYMTTDEKYDDTDILLSFSQCVGLDSKLVPGTLIVPNEFIPFDIQNNKIHICDKYNVVNDLIEKLPMIFESKYVSIATDHINSKYVSDNESKKNHIGTIINEHDFIVTPVLQLNGLWNPTDKQEQIMLIK